VRVVDNRDELRYEVWVDGRLAGYIRYTFDEDVVTMVHTEIEPAFEGKGVGSGLVKGALDDARGRGFTVLPLCPFVAAWIERHPEYAA
jgi:predicted GNAT family acetyltransferase